MHCEKPLNARHLTVNFKVINGYLKRDLYIPENQVYTNLFSFLFFCSSV